MTRGTVRALGWIILLIFLCSTAAPAQDKSQLSRAMSQMQSSFEELEKNIENDSLNQDNVLSIYHLVQAAEFAASLDPPGSERMQGAKREQYIKGYRAALRAMISDAEQLNEMVKTQKPAEDRYKQLMKVLSHQKRGHRQFQSR